MDKCTRGIFCSSMFILLSGNKSIVPIQTTTLTLDDKGLRLGGKLTLRGIQIQIKSDKSSWPEEYMAFNFCPFCGERIDWFKELKE